MVTGLLHLLLALPAQAGATPPSEPAANLPRATAVWVDPARLLVDGDGSEWRGERAADVQIDRLEQLVALDSRAPLERWSGPRDASLRLWVGWNEDDLLLAGEVFDEAADYDAGQWYRGDSLELFLNTRDRQPRWGGDDFQVMLAPDWPDRPWGVYAHEGSATRAVDGGFGGVEVASHPFLGGYRFEARLPWRNFAGFAPQPGAALAFNFALCDRDGRGAQESYGTWTGEAGIATFADRRGELHLAPLPEGAPAASTDAAPSKRPPTVLLALLAATYALALSTRKVWRRPRAMRRGLVAGAAVLVLAIGPSLLARFSARSAGEERRHDLERYGSRFDALLRSGALGHPEPDLLQQRVAALLSDQALPAIKRTRFHPLAPPGASLGPELATARRGLPYCPIRWQGEPQTGSGSAGIDLSEGTELVLELGDTLPVDAIQLVTQVSDPRALRAGSERVIVLAAELALAGTPLAGPREVRHLQDLHHQEDEHRDVPGIEPAFYAPGGRLGRVHGDGILLELDGPREADRLVLRRVGPTAYDVRLIAVAVRTSAEPSLPPGLRATPEGTWKWQDWREGIRAEVTALGRAPKEGASGTLVRPLVLGDEPVGLVHLFDTTPLPLPTRWDPLPIGSLLFLSPFLVALLAERLAMRRRIRGKLAVGFAVSSAVPLLALTLLLEASLGQEHESFQSRRAQAALVEAEQHLEREQRDLEREARRLLRIAELSKKVTGEWPGESAVLEAWWGQSEGTLRFLERIAPDGRRVRIGSGPRWREVPRGHVFESGLERPWGQLLICGVARTSSGAEQPLTVAVGRPVSLSEPRADRAGERGAKDGGPSVQLLGAGRDPRPALEDLSSSGSRELRRPLFSDQDGELVGVLVAGWGERGVPVLGEYTLTELLLAAGLTALFTALLFAGILTGHLVGPIERLDRALREGRAAEVAPEVDDEIGHLAGAIRSTTSELGERVRQLETLQLAQEELSRQLDADRARAAVLRFFDLHGAARTLWLVWGGESGEHPRLFGLAGRDGVRSLPLSDATGLLGRSLTAGQVLHFRDQRGLPSLSEAERTLLGPISRLLALPLLAAGRSRGALVLGFQESDAEPDLAFLRAASAQAAIALENARLYHQAISDGVTGFLFDPAFRQRFSEEIQRAEGHSGSGVLLVQVRLTSLPDSDERVAERLREAARRMRQSVRGMAVFGRSGSADLKVAIPWSGRQPHFGAAERRIVERVAAAPWPDGEPVAGLLSSHAAWPVDGPSARFVIHRAEERLAAVQTGLPAPSLAALREELPEDFVAGAPGMVQLLETLRRLAVQQVTLLITGETGAGKDRLAELVHRWSPRRAGPLVHIHCPSLLEALIEDELFGHEKGAFTGAHARRMGPFEYASGGTVVLDEVAGLPAEGQVALLRLLESREVQPLGAQHPLPIDVRLIATTARDLATEVEQGRFRSDLYFRLNVAQISVPPLRLRRQALPELVQAFIQRFNASAARPVIGVDPKVLDLFFEHPWPGNVRELENVLARGLILAEGTELRPEHIELSVAAASTTPGPRAEGLNERQVRLLERLPLGGIISSAEVAEREGVSGRTALRDLLDLAERGWLVREGERRGTRFRRAFAPAAARFEQYLHDPV